MRNTIFFFIAVIISSCSTSSHKAERNNKISADTIKPGFKIQNQECQSLSTGFFIKCGFIVSSFYEVIDEQTFDVDHNGIADSLASISPKNMLLPSVYPYCRNEKKGNRILLVLIGTFRGSYDNVIRNEPGIATVGTEQIEKSISGFKLTYQKGQSCFFNYEISVNFYNNNLFVDSIAASAGCPAEKERSSLLKYSKGELPLKSFTRTAVSTLELESSQ
ncbi:MAG: hypothetical protein ACTHLE_21060 [Agriterribacter sp.]